MNILYQFNEKYVPYAGVSMTSLFDNNKNIDRIDIYVLGEGLEPESIEKFYQLANEYSNIVGKVRQIHFLDTDELVEKMKKLKMPTYRGSYAANMRLFVSNILDSIQESKMHTQEEMDSANKDRRLLYLDADTIITGSLEEMYNSKIKTLGMVYDTLGCQHKYEIGLESQDGYYNSGVILYDLDKWEEGQFTDKIVDHVTNVRAQYPSPDQDLINVVVRDEICPLPVGCNFQPHLRDYSYIAFMKAFRPHPFYSGEDVAKANAKPIILHAFRYIGEFPWHKGNLHPFNREFDKYLKLSPWNDYVKKASDTGVALKVEKLLYEMLPRGIFLGIFTFAHKAFYGNANKKSEKNVISKAM